MTTKETQANPVPKEELNPAGVFAHPMQVVHAKDLHNCGKANHSQVVEDRCACFAARRRRGNAGWRKIEAPRCGDRTGLSRCPGEVRRVPDLGCMISAFSVQVAVCVMPPIMDKLPGPPRHRGGQRQGRRGHVHAQREFRIRAPTDRGKERAHRCGHPRPQHPWHAGASTTVQRVRDGGAEIVKLLRQVRRSTRLRLRPSPRPSPTSRIRSACCLARRISEASMA